MPRYSDFFVDERFSGWKYLFSDLNAVLITGDAVRHLPGFLRTASTCVACVKDAEQARKLGEAVRLLDGGVAWVVCCEPTALPFRDSTVCTCVASENRSTSEFERVLQPRGELGVVEPSRLFGPLPSSSRRGDPVWSDKPGSTAMVWERYVAIPHIDRFKVLTLERGGRGAADGLDLHNTMRPVGRIMKRILGVLVRFGMSSRLSGVRIARRHKYEPPGGQLKGEGLVPAALVSPAAGRMGKAVVLLTSGNRRVYLKIADSDPHRSHLVREAHALSRLADVGFGPSHVPEAVASGRVGDAQFVGLSSPNERLGKPLRGPHTRVVRFLERLAVLTGRDACVAQSYVWDDVSLGLQRWLEIDPEGYRAAVDTGDELRTSLGELELSLPDVHGDFVPWNTFSTDEGVFVIDWEWSQEFGLPCYDLFNFLTHGEVSIRRGRPENILRSLFFGRDRRVRSAVERLAWGAGVAEPTQTYDFFRLYLLHWVCFNMTVTTDIKDEDRIYLALFATVTSDPLFSRERWLGGN